MSVVTCDALAGQSHFCMRYTTQRVDLSSLPHHHLEL